jgi:hypothetical protein
MRQIDLCSKREELAFCTVEYGKAMFVCQSQRQYTPIVS